jgi:hypothetical protein
MWPSKYSSDTALSVTRQSLNSGRPGRGSARSRRRRVTFRRPALNWSTGGLDGKAQLEVNGSEYAGSIADRRCAGQPGAPRVDLAEWTPPDIRTLGEDPFGKLVKYGRALMVDTANQIGPSVSDPAKRLSGNNLNCESCHLKAGTQPYSMPLTGVWGQFPQYRGREGEVGTLEERINNPVYRAIAERGYALRRKSAARTRARNCSGVSGVVSGGGVGAGAGFTVAGAAGFATFFAALRAASRASCLAAKSFASASTVSAGAPSRAMRWS